MEPIFHLLIPPLLLMAIFPKLDKKLILALIPLTFIMDFDLLIPGYHRMLFHNIFFVIILTLIIYYSIGKTAGLISLYYLTSHIILDMGYWGIALFYPFYNKFIYVTANILNEQWKITPNFKIATISVTTQQIAKSYSYLLTEIGIMILVLVIILIIAKKLNLINKKGKQHLLS